MSQGSWDLQLSPATPLNLWNSLRKFGHIVVTSQRVDPNLLSDADMLAAARYVGVLLRREIVSGGIDLSGAGLVWWLGDEEEKGDLIEIEVSLTSSTLDAALTALLPAAITKGTVTEPAGTTYTGVHQWESPLEAIRTVCASMGCEFRVNMDGTLDAGPNVDIWPTVASPNVVVTAESGKDPNYLAVDSDSLAISFDAAPYATRVIVVTEDSDNVRTLVGYVDRSPAPTEVDLHGNLIDRTYMTETFGEPVSVATYVLSQLNDRAEIAEINIDTAFRDISEGGFEVGDGFWAYDPPAFVDEANEIPFRGELINPKLLRLLSASWSVHSGMGVYYRPPDASPTYIDLNQYVIWEDETSEGGVRL